jgi:predicted RNase H-like nuclease (RuvC/YqgF family)
VLKDFPPGADVQVGFRIGRDLLRSGHMGLFSVDRKEKKQEQVARELPPEPVERPVARREPPPEPPPAVYGIDRAIELMRSVPADDQNLQLVVQVIRSTLASTNVSVEAIIEDASKKQERIQRRVARLADEIVGLEKEIQLREEETRTLERDFEETTQVKARLSLGLGVSAPEPESEPEAVQEEVTESTPPEGTPLSASA